MKTATATTELQNTYLLDLISQNPDKEIVVRTNLAGELIVIVKNHNANSDEKYTIKKVSEGRKDTVTVSKEKGQFTTKHLVRKYFKDAPYRDKAWLEERLKEHGTYAAIAEAEGMNEKTIANWGKKFGFKQRDENVKKEFEKLHKAGHITTSDYATWAAEKGLAISTLYRWARGDEPSKPRTKKPKTPNPDVRPKRKRGQNLRTKRST
jgi:hypothetical protein